MMASSAIAIEQPQFPLEEIPAGSMSPGKLRLKAGVVNRRALDTRLLVRLKQEKVGTFKIECQALELATEAKLENLKREGKKGQGEKKWEKICTFAELAFSNCLDRVYNGQNNRIF